ncbi:hypothetical protein NM208_g4829 [Fusarium decemcellulare]|uniref:Uncharacterized protein n=1 Tax=Fusarium decemcellulare TaxID=57161 RepID=A0ACC1SJA4_9HYPO|nr:hypothetical protein NM208_g4829 [Fusarium decemcellulare]
MPKFEFYGVRKGRKTGVYDSWAACGKQVLGYKKHCFKGFKNEDEAWKFVNSATDPLPAASSATVAPEPAVEARPALQQHIDSLSDAGDSADEGALTPSDTVDTVDSSSIISGPSNDVYDNMEQAVKRLRQIFADYKAVRISAPAEQ